MARAQYTGWWTRDLDDELYWLQGMLLEFDCSNEACFAFGNLCMQGPTSFQEGRKIFVHISRQGRCFACS